MAKETSPAPPETIDINVNDGSQTRIIRTSEEGTVEDLTPQKAKPLAPGEAMQAPEAKLKGGK